MIPTVDLALAIMREPESEFTVAIRAEAEAVLLRELQSTRPNRADTAQSTLAPNAGNAPRPLELNAKTRPWLMAQILDAGDQREFIMDSRPLLEILLNRLARIGALRYPDGRPGTVIPRERID